jgi:hypothetical protein
MGVGASFRLVFSTPPVDYFYLAFLAAWRFALALNHALQY